MLAIEVNFLTGRFVATAHHDRSRPEWPPHPARLFSALVATWGEGEDSHEREALEWLEAQSPPSIVVPDGTPRKVLTHFVPVNDSKVVKSIDKYMENARKIETLEKELQVALQESEGEITKAVEKLQKDLDKAKEFQVWATFGDKSDPDLSLMPEHRPKQARTFPSVTPDEPRVTYLWSTSPSSEIAEALDGLTERVTRIGHSSSLVSCRLATDPPSPNRIPSEAGEPLRCIREGQLAALEKLHKSHEANKPRTLPFEPVRYKEVDIDKAGKPPSILADTAGEWLVFEFVAKDRNVPATQTVAIASVFRLALLHYADDPIPESISGHQPNGQPSPDPHVGFLALPWVQSEHSDGRIMGAAINLPESMNEDSKNAVYRAIAKWEAERQGEPLKLTFGAKGDMSMTRMTGPSQLVTLRRNRWNGKSQRWATATPIALPTHPGQLSKGTAPSRAKAWAKAEEIIANSCRHVGLPEPTDVVVSFSPFVPGSRPASKYPAFKQRGRDGNQVARRLVHAAVTFDQPVRGPLLLGSGRFLGLGLMVPVRAEGDSNA